MNLRRDFKDRDDLLNYLRSQFPDAAGGLSPLRGGRAVAEDLLAAFPAPRYAASRNFLNGSISRLSPYIRHGVITLTEVLEFLRRRFPGHKLEKFVQELAWRDYWQRVYSKIGDGIWEDLEPAKTGAVYREEMPRDWGSTGLACMDGFAAELESTGYLHNHARMWVASYLVHWCKTAWQTGARWFLRHLLDGDPASNNLSWQWVASTFSSKPYFFNRENLERYTGGVYCGSCRCREACPFDKDYATLSKELFPGGVPQLS
jgi:deoxyribodipyrimidine photo-lyase